MDESEIKEPMITDGARYSPLYAIYLHTLAAVLRNIVSYISGQHDGFDKDLILDSPGLGSGKVKISICLPSSQESKAGELKPMILVIEGGGFVLGQPRDGKRIDRMLADEV